MQKNREGRIIVIYDDDERIAHNCATTLVQRGYDNLFMLSGGKKNPLVISMKYLPLYIFIHILYYTCFGIYIVYKV